MARTRRFVRGWGIPLAAFCLAAAVLFTSTPQASAADPVGQVQAQLAAGEFGPALATAGGVAWMRSALATALSRSGSASKAAAGTTASASTATARSR